MTQQSNLPIEVLFASNSAMSTLIQTVDWSKTPLDTVTHWSPSLRWAVQMILASRSPMQILWGPTGIQLYNDAYSLLLGTAHPQTLGQPIADAHWTVLKPDWEQIYRTGKPAELTHQLCWLNRQLPQEECYFTFTYTPIRELDGSISGVLNLATETTAAVISQRRSHFLTDLIQQLQKVKTLEDLKALTSQLSLIPDLPFLLFYQVHLKRNQVYLINNVPFPAPVTIDLRDQRWNFQKIIQTGVPELITGLSGYFPEGLLSERGIESAWIFPLTRSGQFPLGFLVAGINPHQVFDDEYRQFLRAIAQSLTLTLANLCPDSDFQLATLTTQLHAEIIERQQAEEQFQQLSTTAPGVFWHLEFPSRRLIYVSPSYAQLWGRSCESLYADSKNWIDGIHPEDRHRVQTAALTHSSGTQFEQQYRVLRPDGSVRWVRDRGFPIRNAQGEIDRVVGFAEDITERYLAEVALKQSEQRFRAAQELSLDAFTVLRSIRNETHQIIDFEWTYVNPKAGEILQHPPETLVGQRLLEVLPGNRTNSELFERYVQVVETGQPHDIEIPYSSEGITGWFRNMAVKLEDGIAISFSDISDRKRNEQALRESEARFRGVVESNLVGILFWEANGCITDGNHLALELLGYSRSEIQTGQITWQQITPTEYQDLDEQMRSQTLKTGACTPFEKAYIRKEGQQIPILTGYALLSGYSDRGLAYLLDITERKQAEAAQRLLAEASAVLVSSLDYQTMLAGITQLVVPTLADFCCIDVLRSDHKLQRLAWHSTYPDRQDWFSQAQNSVPSLADRHHPIITVLEQGKGMLIPEVTAAVMESVAINPEHLQFIRGSQFTSIIAVPLLAHDRKLGVMSLCLVKDSCRTYSASDLILAEELAYRVALALDNAQLYTQAQEANRIKDEFLAVLSHELRSPLNPILGWTQLLRTHTFDAATTSRALEIIERNVRLQTQLIEDLLDVSRILRGKLVLNVIPVNLQNVIQAALETVQLAAEAKKIHIHTDFTNNVGMVCGDPTRLQQVIWNFLSNAVKFTPSGGTVEVKLDLDYSEFSHSLPIVYARIQVKDTGIGISPEFLPHVFEYFRQAEGGTTRTFGGLGLGLAIARYLVELHGGTVTASSPGEGQGATFCVTLPVMTSADEQHPPIFVIADQTDFAGVKILVVDDEADMRELIAFVLQAAGATVQLAASGLEALSALETFQPDVLISDIGMPQIDGYELVQRIRNLPPQQGGEIPAIALTAYAGELNEQKAIAAGFQIHISKPVEPEILVRAIARVLHNP